MHRVTVEDIARFVEETGSFRPFVRPHSEFEDALEEELNPVVESHPTVTSLRWLENKIQFRPREVTVYAGYNGHRKSMFLGQVVADLLVQKKATLVCSMEMAPQTTLARMSRQMSATAKPSREWRKQWMAWTDRLWLFDYLGRIDPATMLAACRWFASEVPCPHIVIDSLMMVCASEEHMDEQKQLMTDLVRFAQETGSHVHLVAHCRKPSRDGEDELPSKYELRGSAAITDQAHNVVVVWANKAKQKALEFNPNDPEQLAKADAVVSIEKQRNGSFEGRVPLWFDESSLRFCDDRISPVKPYDIGSK